MFRCHRSGVAVLAALSCLAAAQLLAVAPPEGSGVAERQLRHPDLDIFQVFEPADRLPALAAERARQDLAALEAPAENARVDRRSNRFATLTPSHPLIPGRGNRLTWNEVGAPAPRNRGELARAARQEFAAYLAARAPRLRIDAGEAATQLVTAVSDSVVRIYVPQIVAGVPVRGSFLSAVINNGNVALLGTTNWGDVSVDIEPSLSLERAAGLVADFAAPYAVSGFWGKGELILLPMASGGQEVGLIPLGRGLSHRLAWSVKPAFDGEHGRFEALVDAHSGEILAFEDTNRYAEVKGGVLPVSNDGVPPDGVEQPGWPMPYASTSLGTTDTGGNVAGGGSFSADLAGTYVNINDQCGSSVLAGTDTIDYGTSGGTDCTTPPGGPPGNTHAARTGFYELNKIIEMARGQLPGNTWLQQTLTSNMNINSTCNAFWNGTVNFYRSGGGCSNTGELAGVFDHEWGHGMDANDATPGIASPSGEGIADVYTALRLNNSCIGRNFRPGVQCGGYGDPCVNCTGVRDIDYLQHVSGQPHDFTWRNANCGGGVHCSGYVYSEAVWSLWKRKLQSAPYNYDNNTAHEIVTRLTFIGAGNTGTWYSGSPPNGGCGAGSGYMNYLAADDDDGDVNNGTPHMTAIYEAFNDQEIACNTPTVQDSGCAGTPAAAPAVTATPSDKAIGLSWNAVAGTTEYEVFRTEGVFQCDFGKVKLGATTGTTWNDTGLQNGRDYSYVVIPKGPADACFGPASACATASPAAGPGLTILTGTASLSITSGDGDAYLDNCENATMTFDVRNTGLGTLTNARIVSVTPSNPGVTITTGFPAAISPSTLAEGQTGSGSFSLTAGGLAPGETLTLQVAVTADEMASPANADLTVLSTETDLTFTPSVTYSFESGTEGWTTVQGTFNRSSTGGGAQGTTWYEQSSDNLANQCDQIQSPVMVFSATTALELWNNFDIEPIYTNGQWYDRANVGVVPVATGTRTPVNPDSGRLYNATGVNGTCGTSGQDGWADSAMTWASSSFSAGALGSAGLDGEAVQLDIRYGTDALLHGYGFRFDQVTVTDVSFQGNDTQSDTCGGGCTTDEQCSDGLYCNGAETCVSGSCQAGTPVDCDDGVGCTDDSCNELTDSCDNVANDANCDNGLFCDGAETCDPVNDCQAGTPIDCDDGVGCTADSCNEATDSCDNVPDDGVCDNGVFCDGAETCDPVNDCQAGTPPSCDDGVGCTDDSCNVVSDACDNVANDANCDNGLFCDGSELCDAIFDCQAGTEQCTGPGETCDEVNDVCISCLPKGASCSADSQCCSNKCRGKPGNKECK